jgi:hypothetical protein
MFLLTYTRMIRVRAKRRQRPKGDLMGRVTAPWRGGSAPQGCALPCYRQANQGTLGSALVETPTLYFWGLVCLYDHRNVAFQAT